MIYRREQRLAGRRVVRLRIDRHTRRRLLDLARERVERADLRDLVVEELDANRVALGLRREDVDHVAAHAIRAAREVERVARVLELREPAQQIALIDPRAAREVQHHVVIGRGIAEAVDRGHRRDDHDVAALEQHLGRRQAHLLDVLVDRRVLLDVRVGRRHVRLGLVVVVVRNEVLDRVVREELAHLAVELRGERLVVREDQRRSLERFDHVRHGERVVDDQSAVARKERLRTRDGEVIDKWMLVRRLLDAADASPTERAQVMQFLPVTPPLNVMCMA